MANSTDDLDALLGFTESDSAAAAAPTPAAPAATPAAPAATPAAPDDVPVVQPQEEDQTIVETTPAADPIVTEAPVQQEAPAKPKRTRRSKAEIEAERAAAQPAAAVPDVTSLSDEEAQRAYLDALQQRLRTQTPDVAPRPETELTPLQRQIREAEDAVARKTADDLVTAEPAFETAQSDNVILIHIVNDGLVINSRPVYRGQEFAFEVGGVAYEQTKDKFGVSFLSIADDIDEQYARWGEQKIAPGPWRGKRAGTLTLRDAPAELTVEEKQAWLVDMTAHLRAEQQRSNAAPVAVRFGA
jgi:hypothetical protein